MLPTSHAASAGLVERGEKLPACRPARLGELRRRSTATHQLDVDVPRPAHDVAKEPSVAIDLVERPVTLELHGCAWRRQPHELALRAHARSIHPRRARARRSGRVARAARLAGRACPRHRRASPRRLHSLRRSTTTRSRRARRPGAETAPARVRRAGARRCRRASPCPCDPRTRRPEEARRRR